MNSIHPFNPILIPNTPFVNFHFTSNMWSKEKNYETQKLFQLEFAIKLRLEKNSKLFLYVSQKRSERG